MLSYKERYKRPASCNPKLPSIQSCSKTENNPDVITEQITIIPIKTPSQWKENSWPPPLNLSPSKMRRNSDTAQSYHITPERDKGHEKKFEDSVEMKLKSDSAKTSKSEEEKDKNPTERKLDRNRPQSEGKSPDLKSDIDRLRKDKRIMTNLLKQSQKELTKKESEIKGLSCENEQLKKEIVTLKLLSIENKDRNNKQEFIEKSECSENINSEKVTEIQTIDTNITTETITLEKDKRIAVLKQENNILKDCLNKVYCKISLADSSESNVLSEERSVSENYLMPLTTDENIEHDIDKINKCVEQILQKYEKFSKKVNECKECISQHSTEDSSSTNNNKIYENVKSIGDDNDKLIEEIKTLSDVNKSLNESVFITESKYKELEKESLGLQLDNNKLEEFLLVCRKAQKELRLTVRNWEDKYNELEEENNELKSEIKKMKNELENFHLNIMETVRLALDIELPDKAVPTDVLTSAIVEMAEECHALKASCEAMKQKEAEQQQQFRRSLSSIKDAEKKLEKEGRSISSLQNIICKFGLILAPKNIDLEQIIIQIYTNHLEWINSITNKLILLGMPIEGNDRDLSHVLDDFLSQYTLSISPLFINDKQQLKEEKKTSEHHIENSDVIMDEQTIERSDENCNDFNVQVIPKKHENSRDKVSSESVNSLQNINDNVQTDSNIKSITDKFYRFISLERESSVSTDLLHEVIESSNRKSPKDEPNVKSANLESEISVDDSYNKKSVKQNSLSEKKELNIPVSAEKDDTINLELKNNQVKASTEKKIDNEIENFEPVLKKEEVKVQEAIPFNRNYPFHMTNTREIGVQVQIVHMNDIGTQIEEVDKEYVHSYISKNDSNFGNRSDIGIQTDIHNMDNDIPEKMQELELTVAEMKDVEKQHMHVACDMAEKLNLISQKEAELQRKLKEIDEDRIKEIELLRIEWCELEKQYKQEIIGWQQSSEKQSYVIQQFQLHLEQVQHLMYEKEIESTEMQRTIAVLQEKLQHDRNMQRSFSQPSRSALDDEMIMQDKKYEITSKETLHQQIQNLNKQLVATKACLRTARSESAKCLQREVEYYNDIIQKKEYHIKRLQTENARLRAEVEGKEAIIVKQRKELRQLNLKWHKYEKDIWTKEAAINKLKQKLDYNMAQTEQEKLSTIGTRCLEEKHHQIMEELRNRIQDIESGFSSTGNTDEGIESHTHSTLTEWKQGIQFYDTNNLEVIQEQPFNELFLYDTIKQCEDTYLNLVDALAHSLGITELEGATSLVIIPHTVWSTMISERHKDQKRFLNAIEILKTLAQNEFIDQEERFRITEKQLHSATQEITRLQEENRIKMQEIKQAEKILRITRRSLERERLINSAIKQNRKKLEQLTARIISQKEDDMIKVEENIKKRRKEIIKTEEKLENIETKLVSDLKIKRAV